MPEGSKEQKEIREGKSKEDGLHACSLGQGLRGTELSSHCAGASEREEKEEIEDKGKEGGGGKGRTGGRKLRGEEKREPCRHTDRRLRLL